MEIPEPAGDPADARLAWGVRQALMRSEPVRAVDLANLQVEVRGGVARLRGLVVSEAHRFAVVRIVRGVPGIKDVVDELATDEELEGRIAMALAADEATRRHRIAVNVVGGVAGLFGAVPSEEAAEAAGSIARSVPGVLRVESRLRVVSPGSPVVLAWQQSVEGRPRKGPDDR